MKWSEIDKSSNIIVSNNGKTISGSVVLDNYAKFNKFLSLNEIYYCEFHIDTMSNSNLGCIALYIVDNSNKSIMVAYNYPNIFKQGDYISLKIDMNNKICTNYINGVQGSSKSFSSLNNNNLICYKCGTGTRSNIQVTIDAIPVYPISNAINIGSDNLFLLKDGNNICNTDGIALSIQDTLPFTIDKFKSFGMNDLSIFNKSVIDKIINDKYNLSFIENID